MIGFKKATLAKKEMEFLEFLATNAVEESALPMFPLGVSTCRRNLDRWASTDYRAKLDQQKMAIIDRENEFRPTGVNEHLSFLSMAYLDKISMFNDLVEGWKKERDNSEPTIEEVD